MKNNFYIKEIASAINTTHRYLQLNCKTILVALIGIYVFITFYRWISHYKNWRDAGYARTNRWFLGGYFWLNKYVLIRYNSTDKHEDQIIEDISKINSFMSRSFAKVRFYRNWATLLMWPKIVVFTAGSFPERIPFDLSYFRKRLKKSEYLLGFEVDKTLIKASFLDLPAVYFIGLTNSGKSKAAAAAAASACANCDYKIHICDSRAGSAYNSLNKFIERIYIPSNINDLTLLRDSLRGALDNLRLTSVQLAEHRCENTIELLAKGINPVSSPTIFILDEASEYLVVSKTDPKELQELKSELIKLTYDWSKLARSINSGIFICNQSARAGSIDLDLTNFIRVVSHVDQGYSLYMLGSTAAFQNKNLRLGRFYVRTPGGIYETKFPLIKDGDLL